MTKTVLKLASVLCILLALPIMFTSCSDDNEDKTEIDQILVGSWRASDGYFLKFNNNGTGYDGEMSSSGTVISIDEQFNWSTSENQLTIIFESSGKDVYIYNINGNTLRLSQGSYSRDFKHIN